MRIPATLHSPLSSPRRVAVVAAACRNGGDPNVVVLSGRLEAPVVDLAPKVAGRVVEVKVREGDRVKAATSSPASTSGRPRSRRSGTREGCSRPRRASTTCESAAGARRSRGPRQDVADKKAAVELARRELERQEALLSKKVGTQRDTDTARTTMERAVAA